LAFGVQRRLAQDWQRRLVTCGLDRRRWSLGWAGRERPMAGGGVQALGRAAACVWECAADDCGAAACVGDELMMVGGG
jgi:hypothetical protein